MEESNPELESFRQQWRAEVSAKGNKKPNTSQAKQPRNNKPAFNRLASTSIPEPEEEGDDDGVEPRMHNSLGGPSRSEGHKVGVKKEPASALEHYEEAVEKETQGSLGDSLDLYRKAFRVCLAVPSLSQI